MRDKRTAFLSDDEKLAYYAARLGVPLNHYRNDYNVKVYQGAELLLYHYDKEGLVLDTVLKVVEFLATERGFRVTMIDQRNLDIIRAGDIPTPLKNYDLLLHTPYSCTFERTVKRTADGKILQDIAAGLSVRTRSHPIKKFLNHVQLVPLGRASQYFEREEYRLAEERAANE